MQLTSLSLALTRAGAVLDSTPGGQKNVLLLEDGNALLLEDGSFLLLENSSV